MKLNLGLVYRCNEDNEWKLINHRSLLNVVCNPFLRYFFNCCIGTNCSLELGQIYGYHILFNESKQLNKRSLLEELKASWIYRADFEIKVKKVRTII